MQSKLIIPLTVFMAALLIFMFSKEIYISKVNDLNTMNVPENIKKSLQTNEKLMVVTFNGRGINYYYKFNKSRLLSRSATVLYAIKKIATDDRYSLPIGYYLIALSDKVKESEIIVLGFAATPEQVENQKVVLIPDPEALNGYQTTFAAIDENLSKYHWESKIPKIFWRGSTTGSNRSNNDINGSKRLRFLNYVENLDFVDAGLVGYASKQHNAEFLQKLWNTYNLKPSKKPSETIAYKYLIDIDGNSFGYSRTAWILYSDSLLMKHHFNTIQWYTYQLLPYVHYLPIAENFNNLQEQYEWAESNSKAAQEIAINGRNLAMQIFSEDNLLLSLEQGLIRYNQIVSH